MFSRKQFALSINFPYSHVLLCNPLKNDAQFIRQRVIFKPAIHQQVIAVHTFEEKPCVGEEEAKKGVYTLLLADVKSGAVPLLIKQQE